MEYLDEFSEVDLINRMSRLALVLKKQYGAMVILLGQLNDKIEAADRIKVPQLHYPKKSDLHGGKSIYMLSDGSQCIMYIFNEKIIKSLYLLAFYGIMLYLCINIKIKCYVIKK